MDKLEEALNKLKNNLPNKDPEPKKYNCNRCKDTGIIIDNDMKTGKQCPCVRQLAVHRKFRNSKLPKSMQNISFQNINFMYYTENIEPIQQKTFRDLAKTAVNESKKFITNYIKGKKVKGITLIGGVGSGKTYLMAAVANNLLKNNVTTLFVVVPDLLDEIKATYQNVSEHTEQELINTAREVPVLILDDLGAHKYSDWVHERLFQIINYRLNNELPILITTNIEIGEMEDFLGARLMSRIIEATQIIRLHAEDDIRYLKNKQRD